jgi:hypothetical protein
MAAHTESDSVPVKGALTSVNVAPRESVRCAPRESVAVDAVSEAARAAEDDDGVRVEDSITVGERMAGAERAKRERNESDLILIPFSCAPPHRSFRGGAGL